MFGVGQKFLGIKELGGDCVGSIKRLSIGGARNARLGKQASRMNRHGTFRVGMLRWLRLA